MPLPHPVALFYSWLGALAFVSSLFYFVYFFVVTLKTPSEEMTLWPALAFNVTLFGLFATHHSLLARTGTKRWLTQFVPAALERTTYVWIASALFVAVCMFWRLLPGTAYLLSGWPWWLGATTQLTGLLFIAGAASKLDLLELAGVRQAASGSNNPETGVNADSIKIRNRLNTVGPYQWVRHPIYLGWVLFVGGAPEMTLSRLAFAIISTAYLAVAIHWEERTMAETFGEEYRRYQQRVPWRIVPGVF